MDLLEPLGGIDVQLLSKMWHGLPLHRCDWFCGLELFRGTFEMLHKIRLALKVIQSPQQSLLA